MTDETIDLIDLPDDTRNGDASDKDADEPIDGADDPDPGVGDGTDTPVNEDLSDEDEDENE